MRITPTVGRVVWFHPGNCTRPDLIHAAIVASVSDFGRTVALAVFDHDGYFYPVQKTRLYQADEAKPADPQQEWAEWMPYQIGQAARTEAAEEKLAGGGHSETWRPPA